MLDLHPELVGQVAEPFDVGPVGIGVRDAEDLVVLPLVVELELVVVGFELVVVEARVERRGRFGFVLSLG